MALVHDLPEVICGDHIPGELSAKEKSTMEFEAVQLLAKSLDWPELEDLFVEFEQAQTDEAKFVKALDGLDNVFTAKFYEQNSFSNSLTNEFSASAYLKIMQSDDKCRNALLEILKKLY